MTTNKTAKAVRRAVRRAEVDISPPLAALCGRIDAADAWETPILPHDAADAPSWEKAVFSMEQGWVMALMRTRDRIVQMFGIHKGASGGAVVTFPVLASTDDEIITGYDDKHLNFRVSTRLTARRTAVVTTTVTLNNWFGRLYWAVVRLVHPRVIRSSLRGLDLVEVRGE